MVSFPSSKELLQKFPANERQKKFIESSRSTIKSILDSKDDRFLLIVGPCSIHDIKGALEFARLLKNSMKLYGDSIFLVMRTYLEKARTVLGWKGLIHDPNLDGSNQIIEGIAAARKLLLELAELEIPTACEFLDPLLCGYFEDLISWGCIGARTVSSQIHRQLASHLTMPIGFKNSTEGSVEVAVNSILSSTHSHSFIGINAEGKLTIQNSKGNPYAHLVLRGGEFNPNYDPESIAKSLSLLKASSLAERVIVDCSHDNSKKMHEKQQLVLKSVVHQYLEGNLNIKGAMLESYLYSGNQTLSLNELKYGVSITDSCLGWEMTDSLLDWTYQKISQISIPLKCAAARN